MLIQFLWQCTHLHSIDTFFSVLQILEQQHVVGHVFSSAMAIASACHSETVISYFAPAAADIIRRHQMCGFFHVCDVFFDQLLFTSNDRTTWPKKRQMNLIWKICLDFFAKNLKCIDLSVLNKSNLNIDQNQKMFSYKVCHRREEYQSCNKGLTAWWVVAF